jgi:uncharacterized protein YjaZ
MKFQIVDTLSAYRHLLAAAGPEEREQIFRAELVAPFEGMTRVFGGDALASFAQWGMAPEQFAGESGEHMERVLGTLAEADAWVRAARSLERGRDAFAAHADRLPPEVVFGLFLADMRGIQLQRGYTGFGGFPGYVMTVYGEPSEYNLARIESTTVHELHHNIRFALFPFNPMSATVGEYIVAEGLAEAFAAELYGEELVGYFVTEFDDTRLEETRRTIGAALERSGFDAIRGYVFGDTLARSMGFTPAGVPDFAGYAIGYRLVQAYLRRAGGGVAEATMRPAAEIIAGSGFFA